MKEGKVKYQTFHLSQTRKAVMKMQMVLRTISIQKQETV